MLLLLLACTGPGADKDDTGGTPAFDGTFTLTDANNYSYESTLTASVQEVGLAADFSVDWSTLTSDLLGHDVNPATDVSYVWFVQFNMTEDEVLELFATDAVILQEYLGAAVQYDNDGATSANLSEFVFPPNASIDPATDFADGSGTWILRATTGLTQNRMFAFVRPSETSENHALTLTSESAALDFDADLASLRSFDLAEEPASYPVDWSALTRHGNGSAIDLALLDQLMLARYDGLTVADLEEQFLDIELIASETFTADVYGLTETDLTTLVSSTDGAAFDGFGAGSLWILALRCTSCANPSPPFLTIIQTDG